MKENAIKIENLSKKYRLGQIGVTTLREEISRLWALALKREDPTLKIGAKRQNKGKDFYALDGINLTIKRGERVGIIGRNGAGKSTLLKVISRITAPTEGEIGINGKIASMLEVGTGFHPELTGRENIYMNGSVLGMKRREIDEKIEDIIDFSECRKFIDTPVKRYSSGMYVKLAFSVAAHLNSDIMIMDEVLAVGDVAFQQKCIEKMNEVSKEKGKTVLYVSHNMNTIRRLCDRCIVLDGGKIVFDGATEKAIEAYIGLTKVSPKHIKLETAEKLKAALMPGFGFKAIELSDREKARYQTGEKMAFAVEYAAEKDINAMNIRAIVYLPDGTAVTTFVTKDGIDIKKTESGKAELIVDVSALAPGRYYIRIGAFVNKRLRPVYYDVTGANVINIEVIPAKDFAEGNRWNHTLWGHFVGKPIEIKKTP